MKRFNKILCPIDFSEYSNLALHYAAALAQENEASVIVVHTVPDLSLAISHLDGNYMGTVNEALLSKAKEQMEQSLKSFADTNVKMIPVLEKGNPVDIILRTARSKSCDLIVMGTHGHSGYERYFMGSTTNKVLHKANVPILTICRPTHFIRESGLRPVEIQKVLCALDYEMSSRNIAKLALDMAEVYQAEVIFLHSVPKAHPEEWPEQKKWVEEKLMSFVGISTEDLSNHKLVVLPGKPAEVILGLVRTESIDLVVLGHHSRKNSEELFLGSVAKKVITDSICPVLVARSRETTEAVSSLEYYAALRGFPGTV